MTTNNSYDYLSHYGIMGVKWGVRRYQNEDGSLTEAGKKRQARQDEKRANRIDIATNRMQSRIKVTNDIADVDRLSKKIGWKNTTKAAQANVEAKKVKDITNEILKDDNRLESIGKYTKNVRVATITGTAIGTAASAVLGFATVASITSSPVGAIAAGVIAGTAPLIAGEKFYDKTFY